MVACSESRRFPCPMPRSFLRVLVSRTEAPDVPPVLPLSFRPLQPESYAVFLPSPLFTGRMPRSLCECRAKVAPRPFPSSIPSPFSPRPFDAGPTNINSPIKRVSPPANILLPSFPFPPRRPFFPRGALTFKFPPGFGRARVTTHCLMARFSFPAPRPYTSQGQQYIG